MIAMRRLFLTSFAWVTLAGAAGAWLPAAEPSPPTSEAKPKYVTQTLRGRVVWLADALKRRFQITTEPQTAESMVALETAAGELHPLVPDVRGRAFMVDARLRGIDVELLVRRYEGSPMIQVIRVIEVRKDAKYELDYWCDICAIVMFIQKDCECCQAPNRLREQRIEE